MLDKKLLQTFVPVNALAAERLDDLVENLEVEVLCAGQTIFQMGDEDNRTVYLLSGDVELMSVGGERSVISAGEINSWHPLDHNQPRKNTATALSDVSIICIDSFRLDTVLAWDQSAGYVVLDITSNRDLDDDAEWMIRVLQSNLFYSLPPANIWQIFRKLKPKKVSAGEKVIAQGELGDCVYFIKSGVASVTVEETYIDGSTTEKMLAKLEIGQSFGEEALLAQTVRNATVTMDSDGELMVLARDDFEQLLKAPVVRGLDFQQALGRVEKDSYIWLDVRLEEEYEQGHLPGPNMPLNLLRLKSRMLPRNAIYVVYCDSGRRSSAAAYLLSDAGFNVYLLQNGLNGISRSLKSKYLVTDF